MQQIIVLLVFIIIAVASAGLVKFTDCGHKEAFQVNVSGCSGDYCIIYRGKQIVFSGDFISNQNTSTADIKIFANVNGSDMAFPGVDSDGCHYIHNGCPLTKGKQYHFEYDFVIPKFLPLLKSFIQAELVGKNGVIACIIIKGEVKDL